MPDLSLEASHQYWSDYLDPMIYRVVAFMEGVENWTVDGDSQVEAAMANLGKELDNIGAVDMSQLGHGPLMIKMGCHLKTSRVLRMLQAIDTIHPGAASKVLISAEESSKTNDEAANLFLRRNIIFERLRLLARVFSPDRCALVVKALEGGYG